MCTTKNSDYDNFRNGRIYLPSLGVNGAAQEDQVQRYVETEFPEASCNNGIVVNSIPQTFTNRSERQTNEAEFVCFQRFGGLTTAKQLQGLWVLYFHELKCGERSLRHQKIGKLTITEHDFVVFVKYKGRHLVLFVEVKSTHDANTIRDGVSDTRVVKYSKRFPQHQLHDNIELLCQYLKISGMNLQCCIMWPFLDAQTEPKKLIIPRWTEDGKVHVFENILNDQENFNKWFEDSVLTAKEIEQNEFNILLNRFVILSCGVFVDEIHKGMVALLTQEQLQILSSNCSSANKSSDKFKGPMIVHGVAGTGKTLLIIKKLELLYEQGELNEEKRALYISYWPGIRCDFQNKLQTLGLSDYVDSARFYITQTGFLLRNHSNYKHIFMDEGESICLSFEYSIMLKTITEIYQRYHNGNCSLPKCQTSFKFCKTLKECEQIFNSHQMEHWGELWFFVDINQASLFLPKHSPDILKTPTFVLNKVLRSTGFIFRTFKQFYTDPLPTIAKPVQPELNLHRTILGHNIFGPPIFWVDTSLEMNSKQCKNQTIYMLACVVIDLCTTKGIRPNNICVIPFMADDTFSKENINEEIAQHFTDTGYKPEAVGNVEYFITEPKLNEFLIAWALRIKGLQFKVVVLVLEDDDFDINNVEDRKKMYIMISRCTSLLIIVCSEETKCILVSNNVIQAYSFGLKFVNRIDANDEDIN